SAAQSKQALGQTPRLVQPALQQPDKRLGARAPRQPAAVVERSEDVGRLSERPLGKRVVASRRRTPREVLQRPSRTAPVTDPLGDGQRLPEPSLGGAEATEPVVDEPELPQRLANDAFDARLP